jgi:hypothetical protein
MSQTDIIRYAITAVLIAAVLFLRLRNMGKTRKLRVEMLWIIPTIYLAFAGLLFWRMPPVGLGWLWTALGFAVGAAIGWQRGRMIAVSVDPVTHELNQRTSPAAILFILLLIGLRMGMRSALIGSSAYWHPGATLVTDIFAASAVGILAVYRLEIYLRARRLLREARGY